MEKLFKTHIFCKLGVVSYFDRYYITIYSGRAWHLPGTRQNIKWLTHTINMYTYIRNSYLILIDKENDADQMVG